MAEIALRDYLADIETLIENRSYDEAVAHCRHVLSQQPKCLEAYRLIAKASLEKEDDAAAADIFQRVLSVDPEDFIARVGLSIVYDRQGKLDEALWQMERGFELQPSNDVVQSELKRLYGQRDGVEPQRIALTRGALARMYVQGDLYVEAVAELRALIKESPDRVDLKMLLAEVLWRDERRNEAASLAEDVLHGLPYCLNANLLLGEIWTSGGFATDGEKHLRRAQSLDPDNLRAVAFLGATSPFHEQTTRVKRLDYYAPPTTTTAEPVADQVPDWLAGLAGLTQLEQPEAETAPGLPAPTEAAPQAEPVGDEAGLPEWLFEGAPTTTEPATAQPAEAEDWMSAWMAQPPAEEAAPTEAAGAVPAPEEELPDWMRVLSQQVQPPAGEIAFPAEEPSTEAASDWLTELSAPAAEPATEEAPLPDWLSQMSEPSAPIAEQPEAETGLPDWLSGLGAPPAPAEPAPEAELEQAELPDWLQSLRPQEPDLAPPIELPEVEASEFPDWMTPTSEAPVATDEAMDFLQRLGDTAQLEPEPEPVAFDVEPRHVPPVESEAMPSPDDALAFLASLTAGKEDQLRAQAEAEAESRMADIMGGKKEAAKPKAEELPAAPAPPAVPEGMPSAEDAMAFLASFAVGKEDQLRAQAEAEGETRMEAIMGGKPGTSPLRPKGEPEAAPVEAVPESISGADETLAFLEGLTAETLPEAIAEAPVESFAALADEAEAPVETPVEEALVVSDYWLQTADDEGAEPVSPDYLAPKPRPVAPAPKAKSKPAARPAEQRAEPEPIAAPSFLVTPPIGAEEFLARLRVDLSDHEARLGLARVWWAAGDRMQSLQSYQQLIEHEIFLSEIAADLTRNLESYEDAAWYRALGDAHMKLGNLPSALEAYRQALTHL